MITATSIGGRRYARLTQRPTVLLDLIRSPTAQAEVAIPLELGKLRRSRIPAP